MNNIDIYHMNIINVDMYHQLIVYHPLIFGTL